MSAVLLAVIGVFCFWGCQKECDDMPDEATLAAISKSSEMEAYIIAGYEFQAALADFQKQMQSLDWTQLVLNKSESEKKVIQLPIQGSNFEAKLKAFNEKRKGLLKKYPKLALFPMEIKLSLIGSCIENSITVTSKLLDMGINIFLPQTRMVVEPWEGSPDYTYLGALAVMEESEAIMLVFADGSTRVVVDPRNTAQNSYLTTYYWEGNRYYTGYRSSPIRVVIHTHSSDMDYEPSDYDKANKLKGVNNVDYYIYQDTVLHKF